MPTILIIDDDQIVREAIKDILEIINVDVIDASDGIEGLEVFQANQAKINGIIIDRRMPKMGGLETMKKLRQIDPRIPIVMSSGYAESNVAASPDLIAPDAYLYKPYEIQDLIDLVENIILKG
ncbi:MAG: response regulator [Chloroflexota bacterium]